MDSHFSVSTLSFQLISFAKNGKVGGNLKTFMIPLKIGADLANPITVTSLLCSI